MMPAYRDLTPVARSLLVFAATALALFLTMNRGANIFDEGIIYGGAMRVLAGQMVHRDFYSVYGPGAYAPLAALFALLGPGFLLGRIYGLLIAAATVTMLHAILDRRTRPEIALGTAALAALWMATEPSYLAPIYPCMLLSFVGLAILLQPDALRRTGTLLAAGATCGVAAYVRYDTGFFLLLAYCLAALLTATKALPGRDGPVAAAKATLLLGTGAGLVFLPGAAFYLLNAPLAAFRHDIIDYTVNYYGRMRGLPFPGPAVLAANPQALGIYFPVLIVIAALPLIVGDWRKLAATSAREPVVVPATLAIALVALLLYTKGLVRVSTLHMMMSLIPATALAGLILDRWSNGPPPLRSLARISAAVMVLAAGTGLRAQLHYFKSYPPSASWVWLAERTGAIRDDVDPVEACPSWSGMRFALLGDQYARTAWYLARHSAPADEVLVGLARTDRVVLNSMFLNYAANRLPGTHWSQFDPGLQNRRDIQQQMVRQLGADDVKWVVRDASFEELYEPNDSRLSSGVHLLDDYVDAHYRPVGRTGAVTVWLRRDMAAPATTGDPAECRLDPA